MVIGTNIGTTSTAVLSALGATSNARRLAAAHVFFNLVTGAVALALLPGLIALLAVIREWIDQPATPAIMIALFHTVFNLLGVLLMVPASPWLLRLLAGHFKRGDEDLGRPRFLDSSATSVPDLALRALRMELGRTQAISCESLAQAVAVPPAGAAIEAQRSTLMSLAAAIGDYSQKLSSVRLPVTLVDQLAECLRVLQYQENAVEACRQSAASSAALSPLPGPACSKLRGPFTARCGNSRRLRTMTTRSSTGRRWSGCWARPKPTTPTSRSACWRPARMAAWACAPHAGAPATGQPVAPCGRTMRQGRGPHVRARPRHRAPAENTANGSRHDRERMPGGGAAASPRRIAARNHGRFATIPEYRRHRGGRGAAPFEDADRAHSRRQRPGLRMTYPPPDFEQKICSPPRSPNAAPRLPGRWCLPTAVSISCIAAMRPTSPRPAHSAPRWSSRSTPTLRCAGSAGQRPPAQHAGRPAGGDRCPRSGRPGDLVRRGHAAAAHPRVPARGTGQGGDWTPSASSAPPRSSAGVARSIRFPLPTHAPPPRSWSASGWRLRHFSPCGALP